MNSKSVKTIGLAAVLLTGIAYADTDPDNAIKYRKNVMGAVGSHTNALVAILKEDCLLYTSPSPRDATLSRMPSSA